MTERDPGGLDLCAGNDPESPLEASPSRTSHSHGLGRSVNSLDAAVGDGRGDGASSQQHKHSTKVHAFLR